MSNAAEFNFAPAALIAILLLGGCSWAPTQQEPLASPQIAKRSPATHTVNPVLQTARRMMGVPYRYGGQLPDTGFDCSGLVYYSHRVNGISVPRTARDQYRFATPVPRTQLRPGDLLFFRTSGKNVSHVGFYLGPKRFLHAPSSGKRVTVADYSTSYWRSRFAGAGRISADGGNLSTAAGPSPR